MPNKAIRVLFDLRRSRLDTGTKDLENLRWKSDSQLLKSSKLAIDYASYKYFKVNKQFLIFTRIIMEKLLRLESLRNKHLSLYTSKTENEIPHISSISREMGLT